MLYSKMKWAAVVFVVQIFSRYIGFLCFNDTQGLIIYLWNYKKIVIELIPLDTISLFIVLSSANVYATHVAYNK